MNHKKINIFIVILLLFILSLNAIYASDYADSAETDIKAQGIDNTIRSDMASTNDAVNLNNNNIIKNSDNNIIADDVKLNNKNVKKEENVIVKNYDELYTVLTDDTKSDLSIELQGDKRYVIDKKIELSYNIVSLRINANNRILDGNNQSSFMKIDNQYSKVNISNIQIINCNDNIGGVFYNRGVLTLENSSFINNTALTEGAVVYNYRKLTVNNCSFENNNGGNRGGAISTHRILTITNSFLKDNAATNGGMLYIYGNTNTTIENNTITGSRAKFAGSIFTYGTGNTSIINNNITDSIAQLYGGVLLNHGSSYLLLSGNNISNNKADWGAAVVTLGPVDINKNIFHNNTANYGGVIFNGDEIQLNDNNFTNNNASIGGCIYNSAECTINVINNSFKNNTADDGSIIYNSGECIFNDNTAIANVVRKDDAYVIKSDADLINDDAAHKIEIKNNKFYNNTDYKRDMLIYNNATFEISGNTYIGNYLDINIGNLDNLSYTDKIDTTVSIRPNNRYNTTINKGNLICNVNGKNHTFQVLNNSTKIHLTADKLDNQNIIKMTYMDDQKSFKSTEKTYNVSVYKNTIINIKTDKNVKYRDVLKITVNVTDINKKFVDKGYVIYKINSITLTDAHGLIKSKVRNNTVTLDYQLPKNFNVKEYTLEVIYSGNPDNYNVSRNATKFNIVKTTSTLKVTTDKKTAKMDEKVTFTAKINSNYQINEGVMIFKVNGVTVKDKNNKAILVNVTNNTASIVFTIPDGWSAKEVKVTAVYSNKNFNRLENKTSFNITKTTPVFNISSVKLTKNSISVKGKLVDSYNHYVSGVNTIVIKINSLTIKRENNKPQVFVVEKGVIDINYKLLMNLKDAEYKLEFVTGERNAYTASRLTMNVKNY